MANELVEELKIQLRWDEEEGRRLWHFISGRAETIVSAAARDQASTCN